MTKTHLNPHKIPLIHCEYQLKQTHPQNNEKFGTLEDWAQNLDVSAQQAALILTRQSSSRNLIQRFINPETGASIEISGFELLLTEDALEPVLDEANYPLGHTDCTLTPGVVIYGMNGNTRFEIAHRPLRVTLNAQAWLDAMTGGVTHQILEFIGIFAPEEQHHKYGPWDCWEPHDYFMYRRSRFDTATGGYGATRTREHNTTLLKGLASLRQFPFPKVDSRRHQLLLDQALLQRTSRRIPQKPSLSLESLTTLLEESLRETSHKSENITRLPFPSGGALHELYPFIIAQNIEGLEQGLWYANLHTRQYEQVAAVEEKTQSAYMRLLRTYASSARLKTEDVQGLVLLAADFDLVTSTYEGVAYSLTLKHVGAWMQTACLLAEEIPLNVCPLGGGDARAFETLTGISSDRLVPVGEILVSS